jgi:hypothetical protein
VPETLLKESEEADDDSGSGNGYSPESPPPELRHVASTRYFASAVVDGSLLADSTDVKGAQGGMGFQC